MTLYICHIETADVVHSPSKISVCRFTFLLDVSNLGLLNTLGKAQGLYPRNNMDILLNTLNTAVN